MRRRRYWLAALLLPLLACVTETIDGRPLPREPEPPPQPELARGPLVVLISVAGLSPERYLGPAPDMPRLAAFASAGVAADAVEPVMPPASYPAHASLISGRRPAEHGIPADRMLGSHGVRDTGYWHASSLRAPTLWQLVGQSGRGVASLNWPSTLGASIGLLLPDIAPTRRGETWLGVLSDSATPALYQIASRSGAADPACDDPGPARDAVLVTLACEIVAVPTPPALLLLRLSQTETALAEHGPHAPETRAAFAASDAEVARLEGCARAAGMSELTTFAVVGDHGTLAVHTLVSPNVELAAAGLVRQGAESSGGLATWSALARSNGGSAFVYAERDDAAVKARELLESAARRTRAFHILSAAEMLRLGADPDAWFGLVAEPGYAFGDSADGPLLRPAAQRGAGGYLPERTEMSAGFAAWGRGIRRGIRVPAMRQTDVAPTLAPLLDLELGETDGRLLVGALRTPAASAQPASEAR